MARRGYDGPWLYSDDGKKIEGIRHPDDTESPLGGVASIPPTGWAKSQLAADVQASLTRADNAYNGGLLPPDDWTDPRSPAPMRARLVLAGASGDPAAAPGESGAVYAVNASASAGAAVTLSDQAVDTVLLADVSPLKPRVLPFVSPRGVMLTLGASVNTIVVSQP